MQKEMVQSLEDHFHFNKEESVRKYRGAELANFLKVFTKKRKRKVKTKDILALNKHNSVKP